MTNEKKKRMPRQPRTPKRTLPVNVNSYFKNGKRVKGYKRHNAGDANREEK